MYRLTVSLGRQTIDRTELLAEAEKLDDHWNRVLLGGRQDHPLTPEVLVDVVKGAMQVVLTLDAPDALTAAVLGLARLVSAFQGVGLAGPQTIVSVEAEQVPGPTGPSVAPEHVHPPRYRD